MRFAVCVAVCVAGCSSSELVDISVPDSADYVALATVSDNGEVSYTAVRSVQTAQRFDADPEAFSQVRLLAWPAEAFAGIEVDENEVLEAAEDTQDRLPQADTFELGLEGLGMPLQPTDQVTATWWRARETPCVGYETNEYPAGLSLRTVRASTSYQPRRQLLVGEPTDAPGLPTAAVHEAGPLISRARETQTKVAPIDIAWGNGDPQYVLLEDGRLWELADQFLVVTGTQTLGRGRLEEGLDGSVIFHSETGAVLRVEESTSMPWTQLSAAATEVAYGGGQQLAVVVNGEILNWNGSAFDSLGEAPPETKLAFFGDQLFAAERGLYRIHDGASWASFSLQGLSGEPYEPADVTPFLNGVVMVGGTDGVVVWRPDRGHCVEPLGAGDYRDVSSFSPQALGGAVSSVNFFARVPNADGTFFGGGVYLGD